MPGRAGLDSGKAARGVPCADPQGHSRPPQPRSPGSADAQPRRTVPGEQGSGPSGGPESTRPPERSAWLQLSLTLTQSTQQMAELRGKRPRQGF